MALTRFGHRNDYPVGSAASSADLNSRAKSLASQTNIAPLGTGMFPLPTVNSFKVTASTGLSVSIAAGSGVAYDTTIGYVAMSKSTATTLGSLDDDTAAIYIHATLEDDVNKTYETGLPLFVASDLDALAGAELLAKVTTASGAVTGVVDMRHMITPFNYRGAYAATMPYKVNDVVKHSSAWWLALADATGTTPVEGATWTKLIPDTSGFALDSAVVHNTGAETIAGVKTFSSSPVVPTPSGATDAANKSYVDTAATGLLDFKGNLDASANPNYPAASKGDSYVISVAGKVGGASGESVDVGDMVVASADNAGGTEASVGTSWFVLEHNAALADHDHTGAAGGGGKLTNPVFDASAKFEDIGTPATPPAGQTWIFSSGGTMYQIDSAGVVLELTDAAGSRLSIDVSASIDVTLTTAQMGRRTIELTGLLTASINIIVGAAYRWWQFVNLTTGAFSVTVKTAAGTGIAIPQTAGDNRRLVAATGTNVDKALLAADLPPNAQTAKTTTYTTTDNDKEVLGDASGGAFTITLPTAVGRSGKEFFIKKTDSSANAVTIATTSSQTIEGRTGYKLATQFSYVVVTSDGANWQIKDAHTPGLVPLTDGTNIATDCLVFPPKGGKLKVTLGGNRTLDNPTGLMDGMTLWYQFKQDATGSRTLAYGSKFIGTTDIPLPTLSTTANMVDEAGFMYDATADKLRVVAVSKGYAS